MVGFRDREGGSTSVDSRMLPPGKSECALTITPFLLYSISPGSDGNRLTLFALVTLYFYYERQMIGTLQS